MRKMLAVIMTLMLLAPAAHAVSSVEAKASVDRNTAKLGDVISYTISVKREGSGGSSPEVTPPAFDGFRVTGSYSQNSVSIINGAATIVTNLQYDLLCIKGGEITIPPARVAITSPVTGQREELETKPVVVTVGGGKKPAQQPTAAPTPTAEQDIKEIKMNLAFTFSDLIPYIILALLFIAAVIVAWKMIFAKKPLAPAAKDETTFRDEALKMLAKAADKLKKGDIKAYYYEIYEAVRYYLSGYLGESYAELTTQEIVRKLKGRLSDGKISRIAEFMSDCDIVKFADFKPKNDEAAATGKKAEEIIEKT
jgi:HEPN domain-containing protein